MATFRERWEEHYASGDTPWDTQITPPEIAGFWAAGHLPPVGLALDIGCGPGTNVLFLARLGLHVAGFDIALQPLLTGRLRIRTRAPAVADRALLVQADVTALPLVDAGAVYIMDVGCFHGIPPAGRPGYVDGIVRNLAPGGFYQVYAFDRVPELTADPDRKLLGVTEDEIVERFSPALRVVEIVRAVPDRYPCRWYLLQKLT